MTQKPKIQYIGQFYVHGSEAQAIARQQRKKARTLLPTEWKARVETIYIDPVAVLGILVAAFMLTVMVVGALRIRTDWAGYERMQNRVTTLRQRNVELTEEFRAAYDMESVRTKAQGMGMFPKTDAEVRSVRVTMPEPKAERTWLDDLKWFFDGLLE